MVNLFLIYALWEPQPAGGARYIDQFYPYVFLCIIYIIYIGYINLFSSLYYNIILISSFPSHIVKHVQNLLLTPVRIFSDGYLDPWPHPILQRPVADPKPIMCSGACHAICLGKS